VAAAEAEAVGGARGASKGCSVRASLGIEVFVGSAAGLAGLTGLVSVEMTGSSDCCETRAILRGYFRPRPR